MGRQPTYRTLAFRRRLGAVLRERRLELRLSQEDIAWAVDVTQGTISNYESGRSEVPLSVLLEMCEHLQFHSSDLLEIFRPGEPGSTPHPISA